MYQVMTEEMSFQVLLENCQGLSIHRKVSRRGVGRRRIWGRDGGSGLWSGRGPGDICRAVGQGGASRAGCHQGGAENHHLRGVNS